MTLTLIYGGTFDPVHLGHIHIARQLLQLFGDAEIRLVPCQIPPHRDEPGASPADRLNMLKLAVAGEAAIKVDALELERKGTSYSLDTLREFRASLGDRAPMAFVIGMDSWNSLPTWHAWRELTDYAHLVVVARPGYARDGSQALAAFEAGRITENSEELMSEAAGRIFFARTEATSASASEVRRALCAGEDTSHLLSPEVAEYIASARLYGPECHAYADAVPDGE